MLDLISPPSSSRAKSVRAEQPPTAANTAGIMCVPASAYICHPANEERTPLQKAALSSESSAQNDIHHIWNSSMRWTREANTSEMSHFLSCQMWSPPCRLPCPLCITTFVPLAPVGSSFICFKLAALQAPACSHRQDWYLGCRFSHERRG